MLGAWSKANVSCSNIVVLKQEMLIFSWVNFKVLGLVCVILTNTELIDVVSNSLCNCGINWVVLAWSRCGCSTTCLLGCWATRKLWSKWVATWCFNLSPVWSSVFLILAEKSCEWAEQWKLRYSWWSVKKTTARCLTLNSSNLDFVFPESTSFTSGNINWYGIAHDLTFN